MDDLTELQRDLNRATVVAPIAARAVVQKGALNIKNDWRNRWTGLSHAPLLPYAVTYDTDDRPWGSAAVIGPDKNRPQGALGNLIEYGSVNNPPHPGGAPALDTEAPKFEQALAEAAERLL